MQSVWAIGMLSQGHIGAPLYRYTGQVAPRFGNSRSLVNCKNGAITSRLRLIFTSDCFPHPHRTYTKCLSYWYAVSIAYVGPLYRYTGQVGPRFGKSGPLVRWKWCHNVMVEADIHLRPLPSSIVDIYKVFETFVCCLMGVWVHPYTVTLAKLAPDLGSQGHL
jgi:hypothetical protein